MGLSLLAKEDVASSSLVTRLSMRSFPSVTGSISLIKKRQYEAFYVLN